MVQEEQEPIKKGMILVLAFIGGWVDAVGYLVLLKMFVAHMSGNSIATTVFVGQDRWDEVFHRFFPIPLFVLGIAVGATVNRILARRGVRSVFALTLGLEALLLLVFAWLGNPLLGEEGIAPDPAWRFYLLAALPALAMGLQNATLHRAGGKTIRTTYISGVLTSFTDEVVKCLFGVFDRWKGGSGSAQGETGLPGLALFLLGVWLAYLAGGILGILSEFQWRLWCLAVPIGGLLLVMGYDLVRPLDPGRPTGGG